MQFAVRVEVLPVKGADGQWALGGIQFGWCTCCSDRYLVLAQARMQFGVLMQLLFWGSVVRCFGAGDVVGAIFQDCRWVLVWGGGASAVLD